jgi:hypothetical protein
VDPTIKFSNLYLGLRLDASASVLNENASSYVFDLKLSSDSLSDMNLTSYLSERSDEKVS